MIDDGLDDTQKLIQSKGYKDALKEGMEAVESVGKQALIAQDEMNRNVYAREIWNAAIEHAAIIFNDVRASADTIRKLKK